MKECKWCHEEMKEEAIVCPHCQRKQKSSKGVVITLCVTAGLIILSLALTSGLSESNLVITNGTFQINEFGVLSCSGNITNNGQYRRENVKIIITCYSDAREKVGYADTTIEYIEPNETLHFNATGLGSYNTTGKCGYEIK